MKRHPPRLTEPSLLFSSAAGSEGSMGGGKKKSKTMKYNLIQKTIFTTKIQGKGNEIQNNKRKQAGTKRGQKEIIIGTKTMGKITPIFLFFKSKTKNLKN